MINTTDEELEEFEREFVKLRARAAARKAAKAERGHAPGRGAPGGTGG